MACLNPTQIQTLRAAIDRIVPADDFPSASQSGCMDFLLGIIESEHLLELYATGLDLLESAAIKMGHPFLDLEIADQDRLLAQLSESRNVKVKRFAKTLVSQTIEGYYSDPGNGGNRDEAAWKMIGFTVRN